ncbi:MAG: hypothetical protein ACLQVD_19820 [Capsulimonadaceae bacterium]
MANLFGRISFEDLFTQPFETLVPRILPEITRTAGFGLIDQPEEVARLFGRLSTVHGPESFLSMAEKQSAEDAIYPRKYYAAVYQLWFYHGIRLPEFERDPEHNALLRDRMKAVVEHAGDFSYASWYRSPREKGLAVAKTAVRLAADMFIIYLPPGNGLCCAGSVCISGLTTSFCEIISGQCTSNSTDCAFGGPMG